MKLIVGILATWRVASLLYKEDGPWEVFAQIRDIAGVRFDELSRPVSDNQVGKMLTCFWCTSIWAAILVGLLERRPNLVSILAHSAGAIILRELTGRPE